MSENRKDNKSMAIAFAFIAMLIISMATVYSLRSGTGTGSGATGPQGIQGLMGATGAVGPAGADGGNGNLTNIVLVGLTDGQVLSWNGEAWTNIYQTVANSSNSYSMRNLTDVSFGVLSNGEIPVWNSTTSKWNVQQPFTATWNSTVNQLISNSTISWSQITSANSTVNQLISLYIASNPLAFSSLTNVPSIGAYSYLISANDPIVGNYSARLPNGTISWSSTNADVVFNAVTASENLGGKNYVKNGVYYLHHTVRIPYAFTEFEGESLGVQVYMLGGTLEDGFTVANVANVRFSNMQIVGGNFSSGSGIHFQGSYDFIVEKTKIHRWGTDAIRCNGSVAPGWNGVITNNQLEFVNGTGVNVFSSYSHMIITNNGMDDIDGGAIRFYGGIADSLIVNNDFHHFYGYTPTITISRLCTSNLISANTFSDIPGQAIDLDSDNAAMVDTGNSITGNTFNNTGRQAITVHLSYYTTITGNTFGDCAITPNNNRPVIELWTSNNTTIIGNSAFSTLTATKPAQIVYEDSDSDWNIIGTNNFGGFAGTGAVITAGTHTKAGGFWNTTSTWIVSP